MRLTVHADESASIGDFTVKVYGVPETGTPANAELGITVSKRDEKKTVIVNPEGKTIDNDATRAETDAEKADREAHIQAMRTELDLLQVKYEGLQVRASKANDAAADELDLKVAAAKIKLDEAEQNLKDAKDAGPDRWEKIKVGFRGAADELTGMFE